MTVQTSDRSDRQTVDYIVVGGGPAGCAVAARLAEFAPDAKVALIEAGPAKASLLSDIPLGIAALVPYRSKRNSGSRPCRRRRSAAAKAISRAGAASADRA
jgi:choline dehydrogenase-like flavoprotein